LIVVSLLCKKMGSSKVLWVSRGRMG